MNNLVLHYPEFPPPAALAIFCVSVINPLCTPVSFWLSQLCNLVPEFQKQTMSLYLCDGFIFVLFLVTSVTGLIALWCGCETPSAACFCGWPGR